MLKFPRVRALLGALALAAAVSPATADAQSPPVTTPQITHTGTAPTGYAVTFRYYAPSATRVQIRGEWGLRSASDATIHLPALYQSGDFFGAAVSTDMVLDAATGVWSWTTPLPPGTWSYAFQPTPLCDGCRPQLPDPANPTFNMHGNTYDGTYPQWSQVYVPRDPAFTPEDHSVEAPAPPAQQGKNVILRYSSPGATTCATIIVCVSPAGQHDLAVYTPAGYDPNRTVPYPTIYLSHGGGGSEVDWATQGASTNIFDNLIASGKMQPAIVVATNFNGIPGGNAGYLADVVNNVIPFVESKFNVSRQSNDRAFAGLSAGGSRAGTILFTAPTTFGYYGIWSSSPFGPTVDVSNPDVRTRLGLYLGIGNQEGNGTATFHNNLQNLVSHNIPFTVDTHDGIHSWYPWRYLLAKFGANVVFRHTTTQLAVNGTTVTATVKNSTTEPALPSGTVQFSSGGQPLGAPVALVGGKASVVVPSTAGASAVTATYSGDTLYNASSGSAAYSATSTTGSVGGTVGATLSLSLGSSAAFGPFTPGVAKEYTASTSATVVSTAGDATLSVADPSSSNTGRLVNGAFALPQALQAGTGAAFAPVGGSATPTTVKTWSAPTSNEAVAINFKQSIAANDALRTGAYSKTLTFTLSTTTP
ncbi:alpha/beta hydrolase-fold protein [Solirubrobacter taibaiensis]|nr:alpha/beta hydrolase-fold protein [Solirubrobacter taibaiensis]